MGDEYKRGYRGGGPTNKQIAARRKKAKVEWLNSLRKKASRK